MEKNLSGPKFMKSLADEVGGPKAKGGGGAEGGLQNERDDAWRKAGEYVSELIGNNAIFIKETEPDSDKL